jgi:two-component system sensor histidine kinase RegB
MPDERPTAPESNPDRVGLTWLVTVRWATVVASAATLVAGRSGLGIPVPIGAASIVLVVITTSNVWLTWRVRRSRDEPAVVAAGLLVCADVLLLTWLLRESGGELNPASVYYLVLIVVAALALGRMWSWIVAALAVGGYAALFLTPTSALSAAQAMHPEIAAHMHGMLLAFVVSALVIAAMVGRLATAVERRDKALAVLHDRAERTSRAAGLATVAAGAAHELGTPLSTIAVAAHELERMLAVTETAAIEDVRLIRDEIDRCRRVIERMVGQIAEPMGESPRVVSVREVLDESVAGLDDADRARLQVDVATDVPVVWPVGVVARAVDNVIRNALQASTGDSAVAIQVSAIAGDAVKIATTDRGHGMSPDVLARAGEPFFTTKPAGAGTGLGLFVTRSTVEQLGGELTLTSTPGRGTSAAIVLPRDVLQRRIV